MEYGVKIKIIALLILAAFPVTMSGCARQAVALDIISNFENVKIWDISPEKGFNIRLSPEYVTEGALSLKVIYPIAKWPSVNTRKLPHSWGDYKYFSFDVYNPQDEKINFTIRLDDDNKKRVNIDYPLEHGWNYVKVPRERIAGEINAGKISFVVLFLNKPKKETTLYFDNMRLVRKETGVVKQGADEVIKDHLQSHGGNIEEVYEPLSVVKTMPSAGTIKLQVAKLADTKNNQVLVSTGVPFAPGQLSSEKNLAVFDETGKEISIATKTLARWAYDNSIRSLLVQFPLEIEYKYKQIFIQWGKSRTTEDIKLTEVNWALPEGYIVMPAKWLCLSRVVGEQVPFGSHTFLKYDQNIEQYYPRMRDIPWAGDISEDGYYSIAHAFYQLYVRAGDDEFFKSARRELLHYRDEIIKEGPARGRHIHQEKTRYIYVDAMIDDYLLTGDTESLKVAGYMVEYLRSKLNPSFGFFPRNATYFWTEREIAFPFLGIISYYELTGDKQYLEYTSEIMKNLYRTQLQWPGRGGFIHNLYAHDPEEGARKDEYGGSPFMTGLLLEAIIKYHKLTNSNIAKDSIFKALDWLIKEGLAPDGRSFVYLTCDNSRGKGHPDLNLLIAHAFGYGYKISGYTRKDYLEVGNRIFEEGVNKAFLKDRKHFAQNYRSSGHFLAYIVERKKE